MLLYIGDSHSTGTFGRELDELLRTATRPEAVATFAACDSELEWWESGHPTLCGYYDHVGTHRPRETDGALTPILEDLLDTHLPSATIVELGTHPLGATRAQV